MAWVKMIPCETGSYGNAYWKFYKTSPYYYNAWSTTYTLEDDITNGYLVLCSGYGNTNAGPNYGTHAITSGTITLEKSATYWGDSMRHGLYIYHIEKAKKGAIITINISSWVYGLVGFVIKCRKNAYVYNIKSDTSMYFNDGCKTTDDVWFIMVRKNSPWYAAVGGTKVSEDSQTVDVMNGVCIDMNPSTDNPSSNTFGMYSGGTRLFGCICNPK